ncbi:acyltransferase family protein [Bradyrhizobium sp.]|uniref:acyltransferase family protein n=1 Tax=Bradyrhizobium sp. TaxID=376 RepID=UPI0039E5D1F2
MSTLSPASSASLHSPSAAEASEVNAPRFSLTYVPELDGLRGVLALCVVFAHTNMTWMSGVEICMETFFVFSGYLITSLLLVEHERTGSISLSRFYLRRLRRLYPPLVGMVVTFVVLSVLLNPHYPMGLTEAAVALTYTKDYYHFFDFPQQLYNTGHLWSLAVEEQFYLFWPPIFLLLMRRWGATRSIIAILLGVALVVAMARAYVAYLGVSGRDYIYPVFHFRIDALLIGCALAIVLRLFPLRNHPKIAGFLSASMIPVACLAVFTLFSLGHLSNAYFYYVSLLASLGSAVLLSGFVSGRRSLVHNILQNSVLRAVGRMSYSLYIWHWPIFIWLVYPYQFDSLPDFAIRVAIAWPLSFLAASMSYVLFERPVMQARRVALASPAQPSGQASRLNLLRPASILQNAFRLDKAV